MSAASDAVVVTFATIWGACVSLGSIMSVGNAAGFVACRTRITPNAEKTKRMVQIQMSGSMNRFFKLSQTCRGYTFSILLPQNGELSEANVEVTLSGCSSKEQWDGVTSNVTDWKYRRLVRPGLRIMAQPRLEYPSEAALAFLSPLVPLLALPSQLA
jgi:hypothetical protein